MTDTTNDPATARLPRALVLVRSEHDHSGFALVRAYVDHGRAGEDLLLTQEGYPNQKWELCDVPLFGVEERVCIHPDWARTNLGLEKALNLEVTPMDDEIARRNLDDEPNEPEIVSGFTSWQVVLALLVGVVLGAAITAHFMHKERMTLYMGSGNVRFEDNTFPMPMPNVPIIPNPNEQRII